MSNKTRVLNVRVVGFSAPERQMLNSIFLLSVAPARQIGYKLWNPEAGTAPDMYLLDGDSESAVASWQATFASTSDRTLVVGSKNIDLGVASASRPLGLKVVGAMDRLAIALGNREREANMHDVSAPTAGGTLPTGSSGGSAAAPTQEQAIARMTTGMTSQQPAFSASMNAMAPMSAAANTMSGGANTMSPSSTLSSAAGTLSTAANTLSSSAHVMTAAAPAATVLPSMTLQPNVTLQPNTPLLDKSLNEKPVTEKTVDRILSERQPEKSTPTISVPTINLQSSGVTPLSPSALSAAVAPSTSSTSRVNLRVVTTPPLAASLPVAAPPLAKLAEAPMQPTSATMTSRIAEAPMHVPAAAPVQQPAAPVMSPNAVIKMTGVSGAFAENARSTSMPPAPSPSRTSEMTR